MGALVERRELREGATKTVDQHVLGPSGVQEYQSEKGILLVRGEKDEAEVILGGVRTRLRFGDSPLEVEVAPGLTLRISASTEQPDE